MWWVKRGALRVHVSSAREGAVHDVVMSTTVDKDGKTTFLRGQKQNRVLEGGESAAERKRKREGEKDKDRDAAAREYCRPFFVRLGEVNAKLENCIVLSDEENARLWHDWLWASPPSEKLIESCGGLNSMHLRGLLVARSMALYEDARRGAEQAEGLSVADMFPDTDEVHVDDKNICDLTARELRDVLEACQLQMKALLRKEGAEHCRNGFHKLLVRFGELAMGAYASDVMDDESHVTKIPSEGDAGGLYIYTCKGLRTLVDIFFVFFRVVEIRARGVALDVDDDDNAAGIMLGHCTGRVGNKYVDAVAGMIKTFHVEASLDSFNVLQQLFFLAPAQRLVYSHNFAGMFNDISQVTYFHYPEYVRMPQAKPEEMRTHAMQSLPCLGNLVPDLPVVYDDEDGLPFGTGCGGKWMWLVSVGDVYLWDPMGKVITVIPFA